AREWYYKCLTSHRNCTQLSGVQTDGNRPSRLLDTTATQKNGLCGIRLVATTTNVAYGYACLSHRWDKAVEDCRTTTNNLGKRLGFIALADLPTNFRDAVTIARNFNIQYLWIDSLCTVKSGDNKEDLLRELAKMAFIYQNTQLTIAAVSSPNLSDGCFMNDRSADKALLVSKDADESHCIGARILDGKGQFISIAEHYPLFTRGWVFEERLLSTRFLHCNYGEFEFECFQLSTYECDPLIAPHAGGTRKDKGKKAAQRSLRFTNNRGLFVKEVNTNSDHIVHYWRHVVQSYMELDLKKFGCSDMC
ncbi:HET-domain-containing protein, partial [Setomelanomma holmii]